MADDKKMDVSELQIEAIRAKAFAEGYVAALQFVANKALGGANEKSKVDANKKPAEATK